MRDAYSHLPGMVRSRLRQAKIPQRMRGVTTADVASMLTRTRPAGAVEEWVDAVRRGVIVEAEGKFDTCGVGLWLVGPRSAAIACAVTHDLLVDEVIDSALYVRTHDYLESERPDGSGEFRELAHAAKILILADYASERRNNESGWAVDTLDNLIASRFDRGLPCIVTTSVKAPASFCGHLADELFFSAAIMETPDEED